MTKIVLSFPPPAEWMNRFKSTYPDVDFVVASDRGQAKELIADADALFGGVSAEELQGAKKLRWVQSPGAGVEWLWGVPAIVDTDIQVTNTRGAHAETIAEHTFFLLLSLTRQVRTQLDYQARKEWDAWKFRDTLRGIKGMTMGIVGFGNIGRAIAERANAFGLKLLAVDAHPGAPAHGVAEVWPLERFDEMCSQSDILVTAVPITPQTRGMIGAKQIGLMKDRGYVLAMSRGGIIDEAALVEALKSGKLAGAGLDVQATEPMKEDDPLWTAPNTIVTPHVSGASELTTNLMWNFFYDNVGKFLKGEPLTNVVDKKLGY
jgi:phosphoglycerate dehydrogenase-like enzyme